MRDAGMKVRDLAIRIRRDLGEQKREGKIQGRLLIAYYVTLATRVRQFLKAIAKNKSNPKVFHGLHFEACDADQAKNRVWTIGFGLFECPIKIWGGNERKRL